MSNRGSSASKSGLGVWPKVLIWGAVIIIGFLYIRSVAHRDMAPATPVQAPVAKKSSVPASAEKAPQRETRQPVEPKSVLEKESGTATQAAAAPPEQTAEPAPPPAGSVPAAPEPGKTSEVAAAIAVPADSKAAPETAVAKPPYGARKQSGEGSMTPEEAKAFAKAVISEERPAPAGAEIEAKAKEPEPAAAETTKEAIAPFEPVPAPQTPPQNVNPPGFQAMEAERARILAEYEAMRKAAEEEWRRMREQMGSPPAPSMPYSPAPYYPRGPATNR